MSAVLSESSYERLDPRVALQRLADDQAGMMSRAQVLALGCTEAWIRARLAAGKWQKIHPGVYANFTGEPPWRSLVWAAVLASGPGAAVAGETALEMSGMSLTPRGGRRGPIRIAVDQSRKVRPPDGVSVRRLNDLHEFVHPVLKPPRLRFEPCLLMTAGRQANDADALAWIADACQQRLTTPGRLLSALQPMTNLRRRRMLDMALHDVATGAYSYLELEYLRRVERPHGLPTGARQRRVVVGIRPYFHDVEYLAWAIVVELDGRLGHEEFDSRWADLDRDLAMAIKGDTSVRLGYGQVFGDPCRTAAGVGQLLQVTGPAVSLRRCGPTCTVDRWLLH